MNLYTVYYIWNRISTIRKVLAVYSIVQFISMTALNYYWYSLILKGLNKMLIANGMIKSNKKDTNKNKVSDGPP